MAHAEETIYWGHEVLKFGQVVCSGPNPIPAEALVEATEIRWIPVDPSTIPIPTPPSEPEPANPEEQP